MLLRVLPVLQVVGHPPGKHLVHGGVIVRLGLLPDGEALVVFPQGTAVFKYHHPPHNGLSAEVGDVVGLNVNRGLFQPQQHPQLPHRCHLPAGAAGAGGQGLGGVVLRHFNEAQGLSPGGDGDLELFAPVLGEELGQ